MLYFTHHYSCSGSMFQVKVRCSEDVGIVPGCSQSCHFHTYIPHMHSQDWEKPLHLQTHGFQRSNLEKMQTYRVC